MSYLVFARKWRPLTFDNVVGQNHITSTLKRAIEKNRVAHAYLFTGTRGVGKTTTARILARALNCDNGPTPDPCGTCESCKNIINGSSFDVLEIDGASNSGVDDIRELRENISYTSIGGKYRIFVIDEVHMLSKSAFNALLKTLEEPPKNVIFIFATTEPQKIPETIHSRCQRYDFRRIATEQIVAQLEKICTEENITFEKSGLDLIGRRADGSMRDALSLLDQVYSFCQDSITEKEVRSVLGIVETELYNSILEAVAEKASLPVLDAVEDILNRGFDLLEFLVGFQEYLRTLLFVRLPGVIDNQRIAISLDTLKQQTDYASRFSETDLLRMIEIIRRAESELRWSSFPRFLIETTLLKLVFMDSTVSVEQILTSLKKGTIPQNTQGASGVDFSDGKKKSDESPVDQTPVPEHTVSIPREVDTNSFSTEQEQSEHVDLAARWPAFIERLMEDRPNVGTFLSMAYIAESTDHSIDLRFEKQFGFQFSEITKKNNREIIEKMLAAFAGKHIDIHITIEKQEAEKKDTSVKAIEEKEHIPPSLEDDIVNEPIIQSVIKIFDGEVL
jgi:DNA polymerase-3 subunit gamma/tau